MAPDDQISLMFSWRPASLRGDWNANGDRGDPPIEVVSLITMPRNDFCVDKLGGLPLPPDADEADSMGLSRVASGGESVSLDGPITVTGEARPPPDAFASFL